MIKLIASDLDGTLLLNGAQDLPEEMFDLIPRLKKAGILFAAASGRQYANMRRLFAPVVSDMAFICENGALVVKDDKILYQEIFDSDLMKDIIQAVNEKEGAEYSCSTKDFYYIQPKTEEFYNLLKNVVKCNCKVIKGMEEITLPCLKMAVYEPAGVTDECIKYWQNRFSDRCKVVTSGTAWIDFIPFQTNKAIGLRNLQDMYGIAADECMAFGDEYNDIEMLQAVKYSFAMAHSKPGVRASADFEAEREEPVLEAILQAEGNIEKIPLTPARR